MKSLKNNSNLFKYAIFFVVLCCWIFSAQAQEVKSFIDRDTIKIGEQITYKMEVEANRAEKVVFPQGQSFWPLEVIDSTAIDTFLIGEKYKLTRLYPLTQFDSGAYIIPRQTLIINGEGFYTDSFHVKVNGIEVDTLKQILFPIKTALDIKPATVFPKWIWWLFGVLLLGALIYFFLKTRKKIIERKKELPPYEKAIQTLKLLDENQDLEMGKMKEYYSGLSNAIKRYIDEKIDGNALESTTNEFIEMLKVYKQDKKIYLKEQVIDSLEAVLQRADLTKFAGYQTDKLTAREDRKTIEENIEAFDKAIPELTEQEKLQNETYRLEVERKAKLRKTRIRFALGFLAVLIGFSIFTALKGLDYFGKLTQHQNTEKLLKQEWVTSEYGKLGITLKTPDVLMREMNEEVKESFPGKTQVEEHFSYGNIDSDLFIKTTNIRVKKDAQIDSIDVGEMLDKSLGDTEVSMLTYKNEEFKTLDNVKAQKVFGTFMIGDPTSDKSQRKAYTFLIFNERGGIQQLFISYNQGDENAKEIEERVINSVEFNTAYDG